MCNFSSAEATNHDRSKEKPNGSLGETTAVEVPTSPPRTTLLGTIFSPVFNFFSPAKNGKHTQKVLLDSWLLLTEVLCMFVSWWWRSSQISQDRTQLKACRLFSSLLWLRLSWPGVGGWGDSQAAGHGAGCGDTHQHSHIHTGSVCTHYLLLQCNPAATSATSAHPWGVSLSRRGRAGSWCRPSTPHR